MVLSLGPEQRSHPRPGDGLRRFHRTAFSALSRSAGLPGDRRLQIGDGIRGSEHRRRQTSRFVPAIRLGNRCCGNATRSSTSRESRIEFADNDQYDRVNHRATNELARAAFVLGKHLVFVSSIAAQCGSFSDHELTEDDLPTPTNGYGRSKLAAEQSVRAAGVSFTILRPVVIYGIGEKGNFALIHKIARLPIPLPVGALTAQRSVLSVHNFNSAVGTVLADPRARRETYIVSDPTPLSVSDIVSRYRTRMGRSPWLVPVPEKWVERSLMALGKDELWQRIGRPLVARPKKLLLIGWTPT